MTAQPAGPTAPEVWILGSSAYGAQVAAHFGLPYCFAHFITDGEGAAEALDIYRESYRGNERNPLPQATVAVWAMAADTQAEAEHWFAPRALWRLGRDRGVYSALPTAEQAAAYPYSPAERQRSEQVRARAIYGTAATVMRQLDGLAASLGLEEVAVLTTVPDPAARRRSYSLLAQAAGLEGAGPMALAAE